METKICKNPNCIHNGEPQPLTNFYKQKAGKDGYTSRCKDCYRADGKKYYEENKETKIESNKKYNREHAESLKKYQEDWNTQPAKYDTYFEKISKYEECQKDPVNPEFLQVKCKYCGRFFTPTNKQVKTRLDVILGRGDGECNFYCSESCKIACPSFNVKLWMRGFNPNTSREVQPELRKLVLARDNWTCQKCGKSKEDYPELELHCHHIFPLNEDPVRSADMDNCETLCKECHKWKHMNIPGCSYHELKC